jgi:hypothetical protein
LEAGLHNHGKVDRVARLLDAAAVRLDVSARPPFVARDMTQADAVHARLVGHVVRRLKGCAYTVETEVPIGSDRIRGWVDILAFDNVRQLLLIGEVKGDVDDLGALERQVAWYERDGPKAARLQNWRVRAVIVVPFLVASEHNAAFVRANAAALRARFVMPPATLEAILRGRWPDAPVTRALVFVDPRRRARRWLLPSPLVRGRPVAQYRTGADLVRARIG